MKTLTKVAILYGGPSNEHDVSVNSAKNILASIDKSIYEPIEIFITKDGNFDISSIKGKCDIVFPVLHGAFGEDGKLQAILEKEEILFIGSGSHASATAMDKNLSNELFSKNDLTIPKSKVINNSLEIPNFEYPVVIKPVNEGSSIGLKKCESKVELEKILPELLGQFGSLLIQEFVKGREFTCGVIEIEGKNIALPATEIILSEGLFDYRAKYTAGIATEITPANVEDSMMKKIQEIALRCHELLGCKSLSRTDMILSNNKLYVLETNTLPGMTNTSFIPQQAKAYGLSMKDLVTLLIKSAHY